MMRDTDELGTLVKRCVRMGQVIAGVILPGSIGCGKSKPSQARAPEVAVAGVEQRDVPIYSEWVGTLEGSLSTDLNSKKLFP